MNSTLAAAEIFVTALTPGVGVYDMNGSPIKADIVPNLAGFSGVAISGSVVYAVDGTISVLSIAGKQTGEIVLPGLARREPSDIAVSGAHIFIVERLHGVIGEYNLDGTEVNPSLITGLNGDAPPMISDGNIPMAIVGSDIFVAKGDVIQEYTTDGVLVNAALITGLNSPRGIAISDSKIYVSSGARWGTGVIGVYDMQGNPINANLLTGLFNPYGIAVDGSDLYVTLYNSGVVAKYTTGGELVNPAFISGVIAARNIAVTPEPSSVVLVLAGSICAIGTRWNAHRIQRALAA